LLVTDVGLLNETNVVWETLCEINGDSTYVDAQFRPTPVKAEPTHSRITTPIGVESPVSPSSTGVEIGVDALGHAPSVNMSPEAVQRRRQEQAE
jgi:hypothetical protein